MMQAEANCPKCRQRAQPVGSIRLLCVPCGTLWRLDGATWRPTITSTAAPIKRRRPRTWSRGGWR
jgi:hypothetical protein